MQIPDIKSLTLREKIAQLLVVRMSDLIMDANSSYTKMRDPEEAAQIVEKNQFGGMWLHGGVDVNQVNECWHENVKFSARELKAWYENVRKGVKIPMIAADDASGKGAAYDLSSYPNGLIIGASSDPDAAYKLTECIARERAFTGVDWIWSPIADLDGRKNCCIGRQYSSIPDEIIRCAISYSKGLQSQKVASTVKHFPGNDPSEMRDSHIVTTMMHTPLDEWWKNQGRIFQEVIDSGVDAVMSRATAWPEADDTKIDGRYVPAGLSYKIMTEMLRNQMGFKGVVITDDVNMGGFTSFYSGGRLYAELIKAGNDVLLGVNIEAVDLIEEEVKKGILSEERIDEAVARVLELKRKVGLFDEGYKNVDYTPEEAVALTAEMAKNLAESSATLLRDRDNLIPLSKEKTKNVAIVCYTHAEAIFGSLSAMKEEFEKYGANVKLYRRLNNFEEAQEVADNNDLIVYVGHLAFHAPKGQCSFFGDEFWALRHAFVYGVEKSIGVSTGFPHICYDFMDDSHAFVNIYSPSPEVQKAFVRGLYGEFKFVGKSPVELDGDE